MLELTGPNTRRKIRPAVAQRIIEHYDKSALSNIQLQPGQITLAANQAAVAIEKARESYRCRDARKELRVMREDANGAMQNAYSQTLSITGPDSELAELKTSIVQNSLEKA